MEYTNFGAKGLNFLLGSFAIEVNLKITILFTGPFSMYQYRRLSMYLLFVNGWSASRCIHPLREFQYG